MALLLNAKSFLHVFYDVDGVDWSNKPVRDACERELYGAIGTIGFLTKLAHELNSLMYAGRQSCGELCGGMRLDGIDCTSWKKSDWLIWFYMGDFMIIAWQVVMGLI